MNAKFRSLVNNIDNLHRADTLAEELASETLADDDIEALPDEILVRVAVRAWQQEAEGNDVDIQHALEQAFKDQAYWVAGDVGEVV